MVSKKVRRLSFFLIPLAVLAGLFILFTRNLSPILISMAEARARQLAVEAMNRAIAEVMDSSVTYTDLMRVSHDSSGRVSMLEANATLMNEIASAAALTAQSKLDTLADEGVGLPLFAALGIDLFSGAGPIIRVSITPVGAVSTRFVTSFESAGINQTRHEISLEASVVMRIVIPAGADSVSVSTYVPIAESIIVGSVPESYVSVPDGET
ncbi:MAG: sporulation protein YunB, partial [Eubacteriales bacterium]|nr:sporulation protein YunB [Eubacteriales bacterium]